ncbi:MAG: ATP-binding protein [Solirubrobacteraceae bacterium]|jgi:signal transduction histidine kinase/CheY-like chemotaxis protein
MLAARGRRAWVVAALALLAVGISVSVLAARSDSQQVAQSSRQAFHASAAAAGTQLQLAIEHETDLELAANAFIVGNPNATEAQFKQWAATIQALRRYPGISGVAFISLVPAARLRAFERTYVQALPDALGGLGSVFPPGPRAYYCLVKLGVAGPAGGSVPPNIDACAIDPAVVRSLSTGTSVTSSVGSARNAVFAIADPVYRTGSVPSTPSARRAAAVGWTGIAVNPRVLLRSARREHPGLVLTLRYGSGPAATSSTLGVLPRGASSISMNLRDGWTLSVAGRTAGAGVFASSSAVRVLLVGVIVSLLLASLLYVLGTGRQRALRIVADKTRQLELEVKQTAAARDAAVEASTAQSAFVATVSHELRTPLAGVIGTADLLLDTSLDPDQLEYTRLLRSSGEALLLVINDILDFSKIEAGKLELRASEFALRELIAECVARMLPAARQKGIELRVASSSELPDWSYGDSGRLGQVITNLLSNAVKFTAEGEVTVRASSTSDGQYAHARVEISDTGIGIDEGTLAQLFTPFTQADTSSSRPYGGTGLGLTISADLIEMMGGKIGVQSKLGAGSTFWFEVSLPLVEGAGAVIEPPERFSERGVRDADGNLTGEAPIVLVAEDNPVNQMLATRMLDKCGYRSDVVSGGAEALSAIEQQSYAAILMDCQMPGLDGYATTREIRRRENGGGRMPIIAVTAHSLAGDREKCLAAGMDEYVSKPLRSAELLATLEHALGVADADRGTVPSARETIS